jgi:hypothetical protein
MTELRINNAGYIIKKKEMIADYKHGCDLLLGY